MEVKVESLGKVCVTVDKDYWSSEKSYDKLVIVEVAGVGTFISRKPVPARTNINDRIYWIPITVRGGGGGTIPISQDFGDSETITISQKTLTEKVNSLQDKGGYVRFDQDQSESLTEEQKEIARHNIGFEDVITVDSELSSTSVNPVQNKVVKAALDNIAGGQSRPYEPQDFSGMGKVYLPQNIIDVDGVDKNVLTQDAFYKDGPNHTRVPNIDTIFVIRYDFDLNDATVNVPAGCVLEFDGGSVNNGKLLGNGTKLNNYTGNSSALYGLFYDKNGDILNYCYKKKSDFVINECYTFVDDMIAEEPAEYQSIVRYGDYLFVLGYPWSTAGATSLNHYQLFIRVFNIRNSYVFVGTAYTSVMSHANGATIVGNTLYVCPADGNKNNGEYINPERKCLHTFNCNDIITAATNSISSPIANGIKDLSYLESSAGSTLDYIMGIDYDSTYKEFALDINGIVLFLDENFNYLRQSENYRIAVVNKYGFEIGTQDIVYKNGIVYCNFCSFDYSTSSRRTTLVNHPTLLTIDSITGDVVDCKDIETPYHYWENQGGFKDTEDADKIWALFVSRKTDAVNPSQIKVYTIVQITPDGLTLKDTKRGLVSDSNKKRLLDNGQYLEIYVDSTTSDSIQNGTYDHPFKTLEQAFHTVMTVSDNVVFRCRNGRTYKAQLGAVVNKTFRIQSYTGSGDSTSDTPFIDIRGKFYNCYVSLRYVRLTPTQGFSSNDNACITINNSLFMMQDSTVLPKNYDASVTDESNYHNKNNWSICDCFISSTNSKIDIIDCLFVGLKHIIHSYRGVSAILDGVTYESITNIVKADSHNVEVEIFNYTTSIYYNIDKLISFPSAVFATKPLIRFAGHTIGNALTVLAAAHKNDYNSIILYKQLGTATFNESDVAQWAKDLITTEYEITEENLNFNGTLICGSYTYIKEPEIGRFVDAYYNILGCAKRGTSAQKPLAKYPFMIKNGYEFFDDDLHTLLYWNGSTWVTVNNNSVNTSVLDGKTINFLGDSCVANHNDSFENTWEARLGAKHNMVVNNYGINGNGIVTDAATGTPMCERYVDMINNVDEDEVTGEKGKVDYVIVIGGKNDYNQQLPIADFKAGLVTLIEGLIEKYTPYNAEKLAYCKIAFFTPWKVYVNSADDPQPIKLEEYVRAIVEVCNTYSIPVFNSSLDGGVMMYNATFRSRYCQGPNDVSHLNSGGHWYFLNRAEKFIESL